ncbi:MAG: HD domain-containing protein [Clostridia bacterium]|nr:HD domain-containing protein [Clostridia bacterium]
MPKYEQYSQELSKQLETNAQALRVNRAGFDERNAAYRYAEEDGRGGWCTPFLRDIDKIVNCPYFSRYADKTQVYSLYKNDDITRRSLHVQLVSRIARTIGNALGLNLDLIEAIALGHDIGHPAFAHTGESLLDKLYHEHTGRHFLHNIHSVRVLDKIHGYNLTLQTLDGIASHNGELELEEYRPVPIRDFNEFDERMERCALDKNYADKIMPSTLEGAVVRISDIIAYLGKDRQDAVLAQAVKKSEFSSQIGTVNAEIVNNLIVNVIENSYGKPYIKLDKMHFEALKKAKKENYEKIYNHSLSHTGMEGKIQPMMREVYNQLLEDVKKGCKTSPIYTHHIRQVNENNPKQATMYELTEPNQLVVDYVASMTDDYFIELHDFLFKDSAYKVKYRGYFDE